MARILKTSVEATRRVPAAVLQASERARAIVASAEEGASRLAADAEADAARLRAEAIHAGRHEGLARAAAMLAGAAEERERRLAPLAREVAGLALDVARRVLGDALAARPELVVELAARALAEARNREVVVLRVAPGDAERVRAAEGRLAALLRRAPGVKIREDAALAAGDVVVETEAGRVDARVTAQLAMLERALAEVGT
jgi:type III secretion protein L